MRKKLTSENLYVECAFSIFSGIMAYYKHLGDDHKAHEKRRKDCWTCRIFRYQIYFCCSLPALIYYAEIKKKRLKNNDIINTHTMNDAEKGGDSPIQVLIVFSLLFVFMSGIIVVEKVIVYWLNKRKYSAESENIELKNKITKEITYGQLKKSNKFKNISNSLQIYQQIVVLEEEIKKDQDPESRNRRLEMLEGIRKIFKEEQKKEEETKKLKDKEK